MSFTIYNQSNRPVVSYDSSRQELKFDSTPLLNDVLEGIRVPLFMQKQMGDRTFLPFPTKESDTSPFALLYKTVIFKQELVKQGFYLKEDENLSTQNKA